MRSTLPAYRSVRNQRPPPTARASTAQDAGRDQQPVQPPAPARPPLGVPLRCPHVRLTRPPSTGNASECTDVIPKRDEVATFRDVALPGSVRAPAAPTRSGRRTG